jgi:ribose transport system ATP-binding protein
MLPVVGEYFKGWLRRRRIREDCALRLTEFEVRPPLPEMTYAALSGGNQQKALLARCFHSEPRFLILHEPTLGVDVGSRHEVFRLIREIAGRGTSVICASSDHEQLASLCDRVLIFRHGAISQELAGGDVTKERIIEQCFAL